ncbi:hypothetical protein ACFWTE_24085 [Nocardiopsis sp. NPDC058631]|uniref:hypothetical protein n=1 Tax=Nocardiopsis sp. NPDC058631 TaxID=3346566 RepID=UPI00365EB03B
MSTSTLAPGMRRVLDAPRGRRFSRPAARPAVRPTPSPTPPSRPAPLPPLASLGRTPRERELLAQMPDTPRLRYRFTHGDLPPWMNVPRPQDPRPDVAPALDPVPRPAPRPRPEPGDGPRPALVPIPRPRRERTPLPPLPRRSDRPRRPASHRRPRRRVGWTAACYALASGAGALAHHLTGLLV